MKDQNIELPPLPEPLDINWPELHSEALGCGVEDRNIHDRYEAAEYGWEDGVNKAIDRVPEQVFDGEQMQEYARAAIEPYAKRIAELEADRQRRGEPMVQFRTRHCADWYDGHPDHSDGGGPYEVRTLYTAPVAAQPSAPDMGTILPLCYVPEDDIDGIIPAAAYDALYPHSRVFDGVREFPIYGARPFTQPAAGQTWQQLAATLYQACGAYDMPVRVLDALSAAANGEPFEHLIDGILPVESPADRLACPICHEDEPHTGSCGSSDPKAWCNSKADEQAQQDTKYTACPMQYVETTVPRDDDWAVVGMEGMIVAGGLQREDAQLIAAALNTYKPGQQDADKADSQPLKFSKSDLVEVMQELVTKIKPVQITAMIALQAAEQFIENGVEFGYIKMPEKDTPDPAHETLPKIKNAIAAIKSMPAQPDPAMAGDDELAAQLLEYANDNGYSHVDYADTMRRAAADLKRVQPASGEDTRDVVYTYANQPNDNVIAWRLGEACSKASKAPGGDYIDGGLSLLKELQAKGYGVIAIEPSRGQQGG